MTVDTLNWLPPWYAPWREIGQAAATKVSCGVPAWQALNELGPAPVRFVPHTALPLTESYELFIARTGCCPTRDGTHDFFNGLCWRMYPATKHQLNRLQVRQIALEGIRPTRGAVRDALTVFDENAAFLRAPDALWNALADKSWHLVFGELRPLWRDARLVLFGHALLEKLQHPRKSITAHVIRVWPPSDTPADWDTWIAAALDTLPWAAKPFAHLPVLGVPGWWPANEDRHFYSDSDVFRPPSRCPVSAQ